MSNIPRETSESRLQGRQQSVHAVLSQPGSGNDGIEKLRKHGGAAGVMADSIKTDYSERSASSCSLLTKEKFND